MTTNDSAGPPTRRRPLGVWVISLVLAWGALWTPVAFALFQSGRIPLTPAQHAYYAGLTPLDFVFSCALELSNLAGAVMLFLLKRQALPIFVATLAFSLLQFLYQILAKHWLSAISGPGLAEVLAGWVVWALVILYVWRLRARGLLA